MRKKLLSFALAVTMGLSLVGCGSFGAKSVSNEYIKVNNYNKLQILKQETPEVTDEEVQTQIDSTLESSKTTEEVKRAAKNGDVVTIDYDGKVDGKSFEGGSTLVDGGQPSELELGSGSFIGAEGKYKGFEEQIVGHKAGDKFTIEVKFPTEYSEELGGKVAAFDITLHKVSKYKEAKLTDAWVKENSETSKTVAEYKEEVKSEITKSNEEATRQTLQSEVLEALKKQIDVVKVPEKEAKEINEELVSQYESYASSYGMEFEDFLQQFMGMTKEQFDGQVQKVAEQSAEVYMACELISEKEKLTPTEEQYKQEYEKLAKQYGAESADEFLEQYGEEDVKKSILQEKVVDYLIEHAQQLTEKEMSTAKGASEETTEVPADTSSEETTEK